MWTMYNYKEEQLNRVRGLNRMSAILSEQRAREASMRRWTWTGANQVLDVAGTDGKERKIEGYRTFTFTFWGLVVSQGAYLFFGRFLNPKLDFNHSNSIYVLSSEKIIKFLGSSDQVCLANFRMLKKCWTARIETILETTFSSRPFFR